MSSVAVGKRPRGRPRKVKTETEPPPTEPVETKQETSVQTPVAKQFGENDAPFPQVSDFDTPNSDCCAKKEETEQSKVAELDTPNIDSPVEKLAPEADEVTPSDTKRSEESGPECHQIQASSDIQDGEEETSPSTPTNNATEDGKQPERPKKGQITKKDEIEKKEGVPAKPKRQYIRRKPLASRSIADDELTRKAAGDMVEEPPKKKAKRKIVTNEKVSCPVTPSLLCDDPTDSKSKRRGRPAKNTIEELDKKESESSSTPCNYRIEDIIATVKATLTESKGKSKKKKKKSDEFPVAFVPPLHEPPTISKSSAAEMYGQMQNPQTCFTLPIPSPPPSPLGPYEESDTRTVREVLLERRRRHQLKVTFQNDFAPSSVVTSFTSPFPCILFKNENNKNRSSLVIPQPKQKPVIHYKDTDEARERHIMMVKKFNELTQEQKKEQPEFYTEHFVHQEQAHRFCREEEVNERANDEWIRVENLDHWKEQDYGVSESPPTLFVFDESDEELEDVIALNINEEFLGSNVESKGRRNVLKNGLRCDRRKERLIVQAAGDCARDFKNDISQLLSEIIDNVTLAEELEEDMEGEFAMDVTDDNNNDQKRDVPMESTGDLQKIVIYRRDGSTEEVVLTSYYGVIEPCTDTNCVICSDPCYGSDECLMAIARNYDRRENPELFKHPPRPEEEDSEGEEQEEDVDLEAIRLDQLEKRRIYRRHHRALKPSKRHHSEVANPVKCQLCLKVLKHESSLAKHMKRHEIREKQMNLMEMYEKKYAARSARYKEESARKAKSKRRQQTITTPSFYLGGTVDDANSTMCPENVMSYSSFCPSVPMSVPPNFDNHLNQQLVLPEYDTYPQTMCLTNYKHYIQL